MHAADFWRRSAVATLSEATGHIARGYVRAKISTEAAGRNSSRSEVGQEHDFQWACRLLLALPRLPVQSPVRFLFELPAPLVLEGEQAATR